MRSYMSTRIKVAFWCHLLALLYIAISGPIYLFRSQFMPYHAVAVGKNWAEVAPAFQILLLALIRAYGGALLAVALAMGIFLLIPFRQGIRWARWAVPVVGLVAQLPALYATISVTLLTPATPPWYGVLYVIVLLVAGLILSLEPEKTTEHVVGRSGVSE